MNVFSTSFNNKSKACGCRDAKCLFMCYFTRQAQKNTIYSGYSELHVLIQVKTRGNILFCRKELVWETNKINKPLMLPAAKIASH